LKNRINCRHSFAPFYPGITHPRYTEEELDELVDVTYTETLPDSSTREWSAYDASQHLRKLERGLRHWKRRRDVKQAAGLDALIEKKKVREWSRRIKDFTTSTGIRRQPSRERVAQP